MDSDPIAHLIAHLFSRQSQTYNELPTERLIEIAQQIAENSTTIVDLMDLHAALVGEPLHAHLADYVEAHLAGQNAASLYPEIHERIQQDVAFRVEFESLLELIQTHARAQNASESTTGTFAEWFQQQTESQAHPQSKGASSSAASDLWQQVRENVYRLAGEIPIQLGRTTAAFGQLAAGLTPQPVPAGAYRSAVSAEDGNLDELIEIPHPETNLVLSVRTGPVAAGRGTLVLAVRALQPSAPVAQAKVTLRDQEGGLLESTVTDENGLAFFRELETDRYQVRVEHQDQIWEFSMPIR